MRLSRRTLIVTGIVVLYVVCGIVYAHTERISVWHGWYCATANAMTEGDCNANPTTWIAYCINTVEHVVLVAFAGAVLAKFTSRWASDQVKTHVDNSEKRIKEHVEARIKHHLGK